MMRPSPQHIPLASHTLFLTTSLTLAFFLLFCRLSNCHDESCKPKPLFASEDDVTGVEGGLDENLSGFCPHVLNTMRSLCVVFGSYLAFLLVFGITLCTSMGPTS